MSYVRRLDDACRRRPGRADLEATDQDRYYDGSTATVGALDAFLDDEGLPWTDQLEHHEAEL